MPRPYDIITFDCYGTLIDWDSGITGAFRDAALTDGLDLDSDRVLEVYHAVEPTVQTEGYRSYRDVLADTARRCAERLDWLLPADRSGFLAESLGNWTPFTDTNKALERLHGLGYRLGILSNIDDDLFAATTRHFTVEFDLVITAQQVRSYKPAHGHFEAARQGVSGRRWLHAAQSYYHDVVPARTLDIPVVWINRRGDPPLGKTVPNAEVDSLDGLVEWLSSRE